MKKVLALATVLSAMSLAPAASADETIKEVVVYGRRQTPSVVIEITRPTAAHEAGAAHESLRRALIEQSRPAAFTK